MTLTFVTNNDDENNKTFLSSQPSFLNLLRARARLLLSQKLDSRIDPKMPPFVCVSVCVHDLTHCFYISQPLYSLLLSSCYDGFNSLPLPNHKHTHTHKRFSLCLCPFSSTADALLVARRRIASGNVLAF